MNKKKNELFLGVKPIFFYFKDSIKFYNMDNHLIPQIVFIVILAIAFGGSLLVRPFFQSLEIYYEQLLFMLLDLELEDINMVALSSIIDTELLNNLVSTLLSCAGILLLVRTLSYFVAIFYGSYYHYSITKPDTSLKQRIEMFLQRLPKLLGFNLLFYLILAFAIVTFVLVLMVIMSLIPLFANLIILILSLIPMTVLIIDLLFIFKNLLIIEFDIGILDNFKKAFGIVKKYKARIVSNGLFPYLMTIILLSFTSELNNQLLSLFLVSFFGVIIILFAQRLIVLMFIDLASLKPENKEIEEVSDAN